MTRILHSDDCGNSPQNLFLQEFTIALVLGDIETLLPRISDDIRWMLVGVKCLHGKNEFADHLRSLSDSPIDTLALHHVLSHGKAGAVNATVRHQDGSCRELSHVYAFISAKSTKVKAITSYIIQTGSCSD